MKREALRLLDLSVANPATVPKVEVRFVCFRYFLLK